MMIRRLAVASLFGAALVVAQDCEEQTFPHVCQCSGGELTIVGFDAAIEVADDYSDCFEGYGSLMWAKDKCDSEPTCTVLHDWHNDSENWRACRSYTAGTGSTALPKNDASYHADWGKIALQDNVFYKCDSKGCYSYSDAEQEWIFLSSLPGSVALQPVGSVVQSETHVLISYTNKVVLQSKNCSGAGGTGGGADAFQVGGDTASFAGGDDGEPVLFGDETPEPTANPTSSPTKTPTSSPTSNPTDYASAMQQLQDAACTERHQGTGDILVLRYDIGNENQSGKWWRCYRKSQLDWSIQGECMDNCGGRIPCTGGMSGPSVGHFSMCPKGSSCGIQDVRDSNIEVLGCDKGLYTMDLVPTRYGGVLTASTCDVPDDTRFTSQAMHINDPLADHCRNQYSLSINALFKYHKDCNAANFDQLYYCPPGMTYSTSYGGTCYAASGATCPWHSTGKCDARQYYFPDGTRWHTAWATPSGGIKDSGGSTVLWSTGVWRSNPVSRAYAGEHGCGSVVRTMSCSNNAYGIDNQAYDLGNEQCI